MPQWQCMAVREATKRTSLLRGLSVCAPSRRRWSRESKGRRNHVECRRCCREWGTVVPRDWPRSLALSKGRKRNVRLSSIGGPCIRCPALALPMAQMVFVGPPCLVLWCSCRASSIESHSHADKNREMEDEELTLSCMGLRGDTWFN